MLKSTGTLALRYLLPPAESPLFVSSVRNRNAARGYRNALTMMTIIGIVFRSELAVLLGCHTIWLFLQRRVSIREIIVSGLAGLIIGLGLTIPLDSFFWNKFPLWPELHGFVFNVLNGRSSEWGTSPVWQYFLVDLPKLLLNPMALFCLLFALFEPALRFTSLDILAPNLAFVAIYSLQPHKEWRFIVYVVPALVTVSALGAAWIWHRKDKDSKYHLHVFGHRITIYRMLAFSLYLSTAMSFAVSFAWLGFSSFNYPGADALNHLHAMPDKSQGIISIHMDALACSSGVTRFLQVPRPPQNAQVQQLWLYDKTEDETELLRPEFWDQFDYVLAERPEKVIGAFEIVYTASRPKSVRLKQPGEETQQRQTAHFKNGSNWGWGPWYWLYLRIAEVWQDFEYFMRANVTKGWWFELVTEPQVNVLRKVKT